MMIERRDGNGLVVRAGAVSAGVVIALGMLTGCARDGEHSRVGDAFVGEGAGTAVFSDERTVAFHEEAGLLAFERFEFGRSDERLTVRSARPLLGTEQWPVPARPLERPFRIERFDQD